MTDASTMPCWQISENGPFEQVLQWTQSAIPDPGPDECVIKVDAAGVNFADSLIIAGKYQVQPELPFTPGFEAVGRVVQCGEKSRHSVGDRLVAFGYYGAYGQYMKVRDVFAFPTPDAIPDADAASFVVTYHTAYFSLVHKANIQEGEVLLVHGGAGGVGTTAIQLGKALGATVIATARGEDKLEICRREGADHVIDYAEQDFVERVHEITNGQGADIVLEQVGGDTFFKSTKCIAFDGRIVTIGFTSGEIPELKMNRVMVKNFSILGLNWPNYQKYKPELLGTTQQALYDLYLAGKIKPKIDSIMPFSELPNALRKIKERKASGKIVLQGWDAQP